MAKKFGFQDLLNCRRESSRDDLFDHSRRSLMIGFSGAELLEREKLDYANRMKAQEELWRLRNFPAMPTPPVPTDEVFLNTAAHWRHLHVGVVQLANATGGWADYLEKPEQADGLYAHVLNDINQRYVIAYYPKNRARDGQRRKVSFEVRGHPEYIILGRRSYFAPQP